MIARLTGTVVDRDGHRVVVDVRGVGYAVDAPMRDAVHWSGQAGPVTIHVHTDVREDAIVLYGFAEAADRAAFETLRGVTGVGPAVALHALDTLGRSGVAEAVEADDLKRLATIPKVGKKLASRLALELKGKLGPVAPGGGAPAPAPSTGAGGGDDAFALALDKLGYSRAEIARAAEALAESGPGPDAPLSDRLRAALQVLSGARG